MMKNFNKIHWEFIEWIEKDNTHALLRGVDDLDNNYEADGGYDSINNEVTEIYELKMIKDEQETIKI